MEAASLVQKNTGCVRHTCNPSTWGVDAGTSELSIVSAVGELEAMRNFLKRTNSKVCVSLCVCLCFCVCVEGIFKAKVHENYRTQNYVLDTGKTGLVTCRQSRRQTGSPVVS